MLSTLLLAFRGGTQGVVVVLWCNEAVFSSHSQVKVYVKHISVLEGVVHRNSLAVDQRAADGAASATVDEPDARVGPSQNVLRGCRGLVQLPDKVVRSKDENLPRQKP